MFHRSRDVNRSMGPTRTVPGPASGHGHFAKKQNDPCMFDSRTGDFVTIGVRPVLHPPLGIRYAPGVRTEGLVPCLGTVNCFDSLLCYGEGW